MNDFDIINNNANNNNSNNNNNNKKSSLKILFLMGFVIVILIALVLFQYIKDSTSSNQDDKNEKLIEVNTVEVVTQQTSSLEEDQVSSISDSKITPVIVPDNNIVAMDISKASLERAKEGKMNVSKHIVQSNEDINSIAKLYNLKVQTLISYNEIKNISGVVEGIELEIPDRNGRIYTVQSGDMLSTIATKYCPTIGWQTLQELNGLYDESLDVGDKIFIPDMSDILANPTINTVINTFIKPSSGSIIAKYGQFISDNPYNDDISLDGVLINATTSINPSAKGTVVDISTKKDSGKKYIKIAHDGGYESVYGNLDKELVSINDEVTISDVIGEINDEEQILYFAIIQSGIPLDPESFF